MRIRGKSEIHTPGPAALLLVEPHPPQRDAIVKWLSEAGHECHPVADAAQAAWLLSDHAVDAALIRADGSRVTDAQTMETCRSAAGDDRLPVLVYGNDLSADRRADLLADGASDVVDCDGMTLEFKLRVTRLTDLLTQRHELAQSRRVFQRQISRHRGTIRDLRRRNKRLRRLAITDPLTKVRNGRYFRQWLTTQLEIARRYSLVLSVLMIDIDHFKRMNDDYGHPFGDFVLKQFADLLEHQVRSSDVVARYGGDEFIVGLVETGRREAIRFGRRLLRAVASHSFDYFGQAESITISIGQAGFPEDTEVSTAEQLIMFADKALYQAKDSGRNDLACWNELDSMERKRLAGSKTQMDADLPRVSTAPTIRLVEED